MAGEIQAPAPPALMLPDERVLRAHLAGGGFRQGESRKRWHLIAVNWPAVIIAVSAAARSSAPDEYAFRFDCTNYPNDAPTARLWDAEGNTPLPFNQWPHGTDPTGRTDRFSLAFNPGWNGGAAMYLPCDRCAIVGHDAWRQQHPDMIWTPQKDITFYLEILHDYLRSKYYQGAHRPAA